MISNVVTKLTEARTKMATFTFEDTTGHECICFKYDRTPRPSRKTHREGEREVEANDRGNQIMAPGGRRSSSSTRRMPGPVAPSCFVPMADF